MNIRCLASEAPELYILATMIAVYTNPQCYRDLWNMPEELRLSELELCVARFEEIAG
jgi:hypothetical protein